MLNKNEFEVLLYLTDCEKAPSQRTIAEATDLSLGTVNKILQSMTENGYIQDGMITSQGYAALEPYKVKRAIFLAAGFGSRMVPVTLNTPKPLVRVHGKRIIDTLLDAVLAAGIEEIVIVRGYLGEQFDQLLYKYPMIKFVENPFYNEANNISSAMCIRYLLQNAYVLEADLVLSNPKLIRKYEYQTNFLGIPVERTDDWYFKVNSKKEIIEQGVGGTDCDQMIGVSYWTSEDGIKLSSDLKEVYEAPGGKERYWEQTALVYKKDNYTISVRECQFEDIIEIDTFNELKQIDKTYDI